MNGFEATRAFRAREAGSGTRVPIAALTADAFEGQREQVVEAGMDDYVPKPIHWDELFAVIERLRNDRST